MFCIFEKKTRGSNVPDGFVCPVACDSGRAPEGGMRCEAKLGEAESRRERKVEKI